MMNARQMTYVFNKRKEMVEQYRKKNGLSHRQVIDEDTILKKIPEYWEMLKKLREGY